MDRSEEEEEGDSDDEDEFELVEGEDAVHMIR